METRIGRRRKNSIRLPGHDYSCPGPYFVTLCAQDRTAFFGEVQRGEMRLNEAGRMVVSEWGKLPGRFSSIQLDSFVMMPNHFHGIVFLESLPPTVALGEVIGAFKSITTLNYIRGIHSSDWPEFRKRLWQRNYFERIIRNPDVLDTIRFYINQNPKKWEWDRENPKFWIQ